MIKINLSTRTKDFNSIICVTYNNALSSNNITQTPTLKKAIQAFEKKQNKNLFQTLFEQEKTINLFHLQEQDGLDHNEQVRCLAFEIGEHFKKTQKKAITIILNTWSLPQIDSFIQGLQYANYNFKNYKTSSEKPDLSVQIIVHQKDKIKADKSLKQNNILFKEIKFCRDLINTPGSHLTPEIFAKEAQKVCKKSSISVKIRKMDKLKKEGFNGLVSVGKGSPNLPCLVTLSYKGNKNKPLVALVGKGVTFDTGGISLKPGDGMWEMKSDMSGAATVLATILTIAKMKLPINLTVILCLAENRPDGNAILPGDIFKAKNGKTIMVDNTDAEGRLVLSDGLAEATLLGATHIIDLATLTGSIVRAIGPSIAGLFSNDQEFASKIQNSGQAVGEKFWKMPLEMEYRDQLDDPVADLRNIGSINAGSITAALFLNEFVPKKTKWAHIDIAGTAFTTKKWKYYHAGLSTAWGVRSLVHLLSNDSLT